RIMVTSILHRGFVALSLLTITSFAIPLCPLATVGKSYQLVCAGTTQSEDRFVLWDRYFEKNGNSAEISRCYFNKPCDTKDTSRYQVTNTPNGFSFRSTFAIYNVTESDSDMIINCSSMVVRIPPVDPTLVMTCRLPVFDIGQEPNCVAKLALPDVQVTCNFPKVNPKVTCELGYDTNFLTKKSIIEYDVKRLPDSSSAYYNITCKGLLKFEKVDQASYFVRILPNFETDIARQELENHARIQEVPLLLVPQVVINSPPYVALCPPTLTNKVKVHCSASTTTPDPVFHFFVDNREIYAEEPSSVLPGPLNTTLQNYTFTVNETFQNKSLKCQVDGLNFDVANITLAIPPTKPPVFKSHDGISLNSVISIRDHENISIQCLVDGGVPTVKKISVNCFALKGDQSLEAHNTSNVVFFTISGSEHVSGSRCLCSAHHVSGCYNLSAFLAVASTGLNDTRTPFEDINVYTYILYVAAFFIGIILVPIIIAICVFVIRHWNNLYPKHPQNRPNLSNHHYSYIDDSQIRETRKAKRRQSSQTDSSLSLNSEYSRRYRDHIELHNLQEGSVRLAAPEEYNLENGHFRYTEAPLPVPPPCGRPARNERRSTPSESDSAYERHIQAQPSRHKRPSVDEDSDTRRKRGLNHEDENKNYNHRAAQKEMPRNQETEGHYRNHKNSTDRDQRYEDESEDDTYVSPTSPYSSDEELSNSDQQPDDKASRRARDEEVARRLEEERLLKLLEMGGASYEEELSAEQFLS
ncbi:hypothetical protein BgiBS90_029967, partial [Biomphalaria glabrata]